MQINTLVKISFMPSEKIELMKISSEKHIMKEIAL